MGATTVVTMARVGDSSARRRVRRCWALLAAVLAVVLVAPATVAAADTTSTPLVPEAGGSAAIPASTTPKISLASLPQHGAVEVDAGRDLVYVGETDRIEVFSSYGDLVATVTGVQLVETLEVVGNRLYAAEFTGGLAVVNLDTFTVVGRVGSGLGNIWSLVAQDGLLYVGCSTYGIATIDPLTSAVTPLTVPVVDGTPLHDPILLPGGAGALVSVENDGRVMKLQVSGTTVTAGGVYTPPTAVSTDSAALAQGAGTVWMTGATQPSVRGVDLSNMTLTGPFDGGVIDTGTGTVLAARAGLTPLVATVGTGQIGYHGTVSPFASAGADAVTGVVRGMAFSPDGQQLYVAGIGGSGPTFAPYLQVAFPDGTPGGGFHPLPGTRLLDTRTGVGAPTGALGSGQALDLQVTGRAGIPPSGVSAVVLNVTVTEPTAGGFLTVYPAGIARPTASSMNFVPGQTVANLVTVSVGLAGKVSVFNSFGATQVIADVAGWYDDGDGSGATFHPLSPGRVLDTRDGTGTAKAPFGQGAVRDVVVAGKKGVPASGATAVVLNLTATDTSAATFVTAWPKGQTRPVASNLNVPAGDTRPNLVVVPLGANGSISLYNHSGSTALIADVVGWFGAQSSGGSVFVPLEPVRVADTRPPINTPLGPGWSGALSLSGSLPSDATAVVLNVTVVDGTAPSYLLVYPGGVSPPVASNLNWRPGQVNPNQVVVPLGTGGTIVFYNNAGWVNVVVDLAGIYVG